MFVVLDLLTRQCPRAAVVDTYLFYPSALALGICFAIALAVAIGFRLYVVLRLGGCVSRGEHSSVLKQRAIISSIVGGQSGAVVQPCCVGSANCAHTLPAF